MRIATLGAIAIASMLTFACTTTTEIRQHAGSKDPNGADPTATFRTSLALSKKVDKTKAMSALATKATGKAGKKAPAKLGSTKAGGAACGLTTGDAACDTCLDASCCAPNAACVADADCTALIACGNACTDDACFGACFSAHPSGARLLDSLSSCVETSCSSACGGGSSGPSPSACGFASGDATCDTCLDTSCCGDANACLGDPDCIALLECADTCTTGGCISACEAAHPSGSTKINALSTCASTSCGAACGGPGGPGPGPGPGPGSCGLTSGDATCDACLDGSCCGPTTACLGDADCVALVRCYDPCTDAACAAACDAAHPSGATKLGSVVSCVETSCTAACGL